MSFKNHNKSKELLEKHAKHGYHIRTINCAFEFTRRWVNPESRIESHSLAWPDCYFSPYGAYRLEIISTYSEKEGSDTLPKGLL